MLKLKECYLLPIQSSKLFPIRFTFPSHSITQVVTFGWMGTTSGSLDEHKVERISWNMWNDILSTLWSTSPPTTKKLFLCSPLSSQTLSGRFIKADSFRSGFSSSADPFCPSLTLLGPAVRISGFHQSYQASSFLPSSTLRANHPTLLD